MPIRAEVVVVGAGIMGVSTARALARTGRDVLLVEQFRLGHARGSSHGRSRIYRLAYPEPHWVRLAQEAVRGWRELERETGERLLEPNGLLEIVAVDEHGSRSALEAAGVAFDLLERDEVESRFAVRIPDGARALYQGDAGIVYADRAHAAFLRSARAAGVRVAEETRVGSLAEVEADVVVVTAGSWARKLLGQTGIALPVVETRETVAYFRLDSERAVPSVVDFLPGTTRHGMYCLADPKWGLKVGIHKSGQPTDPDDEGEADLRVVRDAQSVVERYFPRADPEPRAVDTCLYTIAQPDDDRFFLERYGRIVVGSPCSGHGFKFAPAVGERLAALAAEAPV